MLARRLALLATLASAAVLTAQDKVPRVSTDQMTDEQLAIYRAVIQDYLEDSKDPLNLANKTEPIEGAGKSFDGGCPKDRDRDVAKTSPAIIHQFPEATALDKRVVLADAKEQQKKIDKSDPQNLVKQAIDDHVTPSDTELEGTIKQAFKNGLFTLSEIIFDKKHQRALVSYSFVCGSLCGNGNTLILKKVAGDWKVSKACGGWVA